MTWKPPMTTSTITRADGTTTEVEHVDHAALLDAWDSLDNELWMLDVGDVHNVVDVARERIDAVLALHQRVEKWDSEGPYVNCGQCWHRWPCPTVRALGVTE